LYDIKISAIGLFLRDKTNVMTIDIDNPKSAFTEFWQRIGAEGDLEKALLEFNVSYNAELTSLETVKKDEAFKREIREKIFTKRIREASTRTQRWKLKFQLLLFKFTGLHSDLF
jgi:hypothetical protein